MRTARLAIASAVPPDRVNRVRLSRAANFRDLGGYATAAVPVWGSSGTWIDSGRDTDPGP